MNVWMSAPALGWGSVIGNSLDRGWGYTPNGDNCSHICGLEVVMADGTILRTGMGQLEQAKCWQLFKNGYERLRIVTRAIHVLHTQKVGLRLEAS